MENTVEGVQWMRGFGSDFGRFGLSFPGCVTAGTTLDEARNMAAEALALHLEGLEEDGEAIPEPSSLEAIMSDAENRNGVAILVAAPALAAKAVRVNVTIPEHALRAIDRFAELHGFTRSGFITCAAERMMAEDGHVVKKPTAPKQHRRTKVA